VAAALAVDDDDNDGDASRAFSFQPALLFLASADALPSLARSLARSLAAAGGASLVTAPGDATNWRRGLLLLLLFFLPLLRPLRAHVRGR
jgi:hypothetical protein